VIYDLRFAIDAQGNSNLPVSLMSSKERVVPGVFVVSFLLLQGLCGGYLARRLKLNPLLWFAISTRPLLGVFALGMLQSQAVAWTKISSDSEKKFQPPAFNYRMGRFKLIAGLMLWAFVGGPLLSLLSLPNIVFAVLWLVGGAVVLGAFKFHLPDCPNCGKNLGNLFGPYCPECLGALSPGSTKLEASCTSCGKTLRNDGGKQRRNFRICGCSHCGGWLDKAGLRYGTNVSSRTSAVILFHQRKHFLHGLRQTHKG
jgi:hypothetical protein